MLNQVIINEHETEDTISYLNGKVHSVNGCPAIIAFDGTMIWFKNGVLHRNYGPAFIDSHGNEEYWFQGERYSKEEFDKGLEFY